MESNKYLTIHGHFYQPPRENPWIEAIERQESAAPYHDWNERIAYECYTPNAASRILNPANRIENIVSNYESISFNIGPTLLSWMQHKVPETYQAILEADRKSIELYSGHGNAIAQGYNHIILPLANYRDKVTQIKWGLDDFYHRFKRPSESIWLPETAVNYQTLEVLIGFSIKYIILSPFQANRIRPLKGSDSSWIEVHTGSIDIRQPYRCFLIDKNGKKDKKKFIDIFFYHADLSKGVGFEHYLRDSGNFANQIEKAYDNGSSGSQLVSVCTDGESYGHHERFGDMGLAYLLNVEAKKRNLKVTNYGEYLEKNPPKWEVELKDGPNGEGTAWSCFHGVGRWYRDCGCHTGGPADWNQRWRTPLRDALNELRDDLIEVFEEQGSKYLKDVWDARNDYIKIILDRSEDSINSFLAKHGKGSAAIDQRVDVLNLMEMQRNSMLMFTSCGWFFNDISGIETVQLLRYAAQAIGQAQYFGKDELSRKFLSKLRFARSNIAKFQDGEKIFVMFVMPSIVTFPKVVNHYAILSSYKEFDDIRSVYHYQIKQFDKTNIGLDNQKCIIGNIQITSGITYENHNYAYLLQDAGNLHFMCFIKPLKDASKYELLKQEVLDLSCKDRKKFQRYIYQNWEDGKYALRDMLFEERKEFFDIILREKMNNLHQVFQEIYYDNVDLLYAMYKIGVPIPEELKTPAETTLSLNLAQEIENSKHDFDKKFYKSALSIVEKAERFGFDLNKEKTETIFNKILMDRIHQLYSEPDLHNCRELIEILEITRNLKIVVDDRAVQNVVYKIIQEKLPAMLTEIVQNNILDERYQLVSGIVQLAYFLNFEVTQFKQQMLKIENKLSEDPNLWP